MIRITSWILKLYKCNILTNIIENVKFSILLPLLERIFKSMYTFLLCLVTNYLSCKAFFCKICCFDSIERLIYTWKMACYDTLSQLTTKAEARLMNMHALWPCFRYFRTGAISWYSMFQVFLKHWLAEWKCNIIDLFVLEFRFETDDCRNQVLS